MKPTLAAKNAHNGSKPFPRKSPSLAWYRVTAPAMEGACRYRRKPQNDQKPLSSAMSKPPRRSSERRYALPPPRSGLCWPETVNPMRGVRSRRGPYPELRGFNALLKRSLMVPGTPSAKSTTRALRRRFAFAGIIVKCPTASGFPRRSSKTDGCRLTYRQCRKMNHEQTKRRPAEKPQTGVKPLQRSRTRPHGAGALAAHARASPAHVPCLPSCPQPEPVPAETQGIALG